MNMTVGMALKIIGLNYRTIVSLNLDGCGTIPVRTGLDTFAQGTFPSLKELSLVESFWRGPATFHLPNLEKLDLGRSPLILMEKMMMDILTGSPKLRQLRVWRSFMMDSVVTSWCQRARGSLWSLEARLDLDLQLTCSDKRLFGDASPPVQNTDSFAVFEEWLQDSAIRNGLTWTISFNHLDKECRMGLCGNLGYRGLGRYDRGT